MASMGFEEAGVRDSVHRLIKHKMLAYDGEDTEQPTDADLIKIMPSGFIHLRSLPHFIEYLSSVALHSPFGDQSVAKRIADIWGKCNTYTDLAFTQKHEVASELRDYLLREKRRLDAANPLFKERSREAEGLVSAISRPSTRWLPSRTVFGLSSLPLLRQGAQTRAPPDPAANREHRGSPSRLHNSKKQTNDDQHSKPSQPVPGSY